MNIHRKHIEKKTIVVHILNSSKAVCENPFGHCLAFGSTIPLCISHTTGRLVEYLELTFQTVSVGGTKTRRTFTAGRCPYTRGTFTQAVARATARVAKLTVTSP